MVVWMATEAVKQTHHLTDTLRERQKLTSGERWYCKGSGLDMEAEPFNNIGGGGGSLCGRLLEF